MLQKVLDGNENAAIALANEIYKEVTVDEELSFEDVELNSKIGIWIDPIDGTQEYISGNEIKSEIPGIFESGLQCATVLIGVYEIDTGIPIIGIINQPFAENLNSKIFYGIAIEELRHSNIQEKPKRPECERISVLSSSESQKSTFKPINAAGSGYKSLKVIEGDADIYFLTKNSTFKWDTCAPQAILKSLNGGILDMKKSLNLGKPVELSYVKDEGKCNEGGIIAYRNFEDFERLLMELREN